MRLEPRREQLDRLSRRPRAPVQSLAQDVVDVVEGFPRQLDSESGGCQGPCEVGHRGIGSRVAQFRPVSHAPLVERPTVSRSPTPQSEDAHRPDLPRGHRQAPHAPAVFVWQRSGGVADAHAPDGRSRRPPAQVDEAERSSESILLEPHALLDERPGLLHWQGGIDRRQGRGDAVEDAIPVGCTRVWHDNPDLAMLAGRVQLRRLRRLLGWLGYRRSGGDAE